MRFKIFFYSLLVVILALILMGTVGYSSLKTIAYDQLEQQVYERAKLLTSELKDLEGINEIKGTFSAYYHTPDNYFWLVGSDGTILSYPDFPGTMEDKYMGRDSDVLSEIIKETNFAVIQNIEGQQRYIYAEQLEGGNIFILSQSLEGVNSVLTDYKTIVLGAGFIILLLTMGLLFFISREALKPLYELQDYAKNLAVGEYIDRADSLKEPDIIAVASILERFFTQANKEKDTDQNPMSGLPGNKSLYDNLFRVIESGEKFAVGFVDVNDFSAYNEKYGITRGDSVIRFLGVTLINAIKEKGNKDDKTFHLGGDRFFFLTTPNKVNQVCERFIEEYEKNILNFYDEKAKKSGLIVSKDKKGNIKEFPVMPVCIGIATNLKRPLVHPLQIGHIVGGIRNYLRDQQVSSYLLDRRITSREDELQGEKAPFPDEEVEEIRKEIELRETRELKILDEETKSFSNKIEEMETLESNAETSSEKEIDAESNEQSISSPEADNDNNTERENGANSDDNTRELTDGQPGKQGDSESPVS
ncbi:MAG: diguanylate cyclase domain-containing protein [Vulcanimicrobiota bacterium]